MGRNQKGATHRYPLSRKSVPRTWTPERVQRLRELAGQGLTAEQIAEQMGMSMWQVRNAANRRKIWTFGPRAKYEAKVAGNRFFEARKAMALSIAEAAEKIETTEQTIRSWECGKRQPRELYLKQRIREVYGIEV